MMTYSADCLEYQKQDMIISRLVPWSLPNHFNFETSIFIVIHSNYQPPTTLTRNWIKSGNFDILNGRCVYLLIHGYPMPEKYNEDLEFHFVYDIQPSGKIRLNDRTVIYASMDGRHFDRSHCRSHFHSQRGTYLRSQYSCCCCLSR